MNTATRLSLCLLGALGGKLLAAPPTLTSLFPAGGQIGTTVECVASGNTSSWPTQAWASDPKLTIRPGKEKGKFAIAIAADAKPGLAWLRLHDDTGASPLRPFVVGVLPEILEQEPNNEIDKPQRIDRSCVVNGKLAKSGDVDLFAFKLRKGQTLVASLEANAALRSPMDAVLQVVSPDGFVLEQNHDHRGLDPQLAFTAPKDGSYLVRIFAFPSQPDSSIRHFGSELCVYRLTLTTAGFVDFPIPLAKAAASTEKIERVGWNLTVSPVVPSPIDVREETIPCFNFATSAPSAPLTPPFALTGCVREPRSANAFPIKVTKGKPLTVQIESRTLELPLTPVLRIVDAAGKTVARAEPAKPNSDCELAWTPAQDGTVRLEVRDLFHEGSPRFVYRLKVSPPEPDGELTVLNDRFALAPGTPLEIPVTIARKGGFKSQLELKPEGLPAEITAASVPGKDDKSITLRLTASKAGFSGRFRIVAVAKDRPEFVRTARVKLADFDTFTDDLWLTAGTEAKVAAPPPKKKK